MITTLFKHEILRTWRWLGLLTLGAALVLLRWSLQYYEASSSELQEEFRSA